MSCIWTVHSGPAGLPPKHAMPLPSTPLQIQFGKTSPSEEKINGADLKLILTTPSGVKRALFQAKAIEPSVRQFRRNSTQDWQKLETQLRSMRMRVGDTAFLLIYVPGNQLNGALHSYSTWEQGFPVIPSSNVSSRFGATVISVGDLLDPSGNWRTLQKVQNISAGRFAPNRMSFARAMIELVSCFRGNYSSARTVDEVDDHVDDRSLSVGIQADRQEWEGALEATRRWLRENPEPESDQDSEGRG
ncbi:MAG TPA: hypothetical protein VF345_13725, partial [Chthoniobacterales bacterium]